MCVCMFRISYMRCSFELFHCSVVVCGEFDVRLVFRFEFFMKKKKKKVGLDVEQLGQVVSSQIGDEEEQFGVLKIFVSSFRA